MNRDSTLAHSKSGHVKSVHVVVWFEIKWKSRLQDIFSKMIVFNSTYNNFVYAIEAFLHTYTFTRSLSAIPSVFITFHAIQRVYVWIWKTSSFNWFPTLLFIWKGLFSSYEKTFNVFHVLNYSYIFSSPSSRLFQSILTIIYRQ